MYEDCSCGDLRSWLARKDNCKLRFDEIQPIISDVVEGLKALYKVDVIHRDLLPNNIWITNKGRAKLSGLDLAERENPHKKNAMLRPFKHNGYNPPDDLEGAPNSGARHDMWNLGVIMY